MVLPVRLPNLKQFPACFSRRGNNRIFFRYRHYMPYDFLAAHRIIILVFYFSIIRNSSFADYKRNTLACCQYSLKFSHRIPQFVFFCFFIQDKCPDIHIFQQFQRYFTLVNMLRFVMNPRFSPPSNDKNHWNRINLIIQKGGHRIYYIPFAGILQINYRNLSGRKMISCCQRRTVSLVCGNYMMPEINSISVHQIIA